MKKHILFTALLMSSLLFPSLAKAATTDNPSLFLDNVDSNDLSAVKKAFIRRDWLITSESDSMVKGELKNHTTDATLTIFLEYGQFLYLCDCYKYKRSIANSPVFASTMEEQEEVKKVKYVPKKWIRNLQKDTRHYIKEAKLQQ